jgi:hypothetical protein
MKKFLKTSLALSVALAFASSALQAGWVVVDDTSDGAKLVCCKKKRVIKKRPKKVVRKKLTPCDAIPTAQTYPVEPGEKLAPANIKRCISCDQKYGTIGK